MEFDLHMHSHHSFDCSMRPSKIVETAKARGLSGIAVTDHDSCAGGLEALQYASPDFAVIPGFERGTTSGDVIGLFMTECPETKDPVEVVRFIHERGGLAVLPHPFIHHPTISKTLAEELDAIEGFNARHARVKVVTNNFGEEQVRAFAQEYDLTLLGSSDAHFYAEIGAGRTVIPATTAEEVREAIVRGTTVVVGRRSSPVYFFLTGVKAFPIKLKRRLFGVRKRKEPGPQ